MMFHTKPISPTQKKIQDLEHVLKNRLYLVNVNEISDMSMYQIRTFGVRVNQLSSRDRSHKTRIKTRYATIVQMVDYFTRGVDFSLDNPSNSKEIYDLLVQMLQAWRDHMGSSVNQGSFPVDLLVSMDAMASKVFGYACAFTPQEREESSLAQKILGGSFNSQTFQKVKPEIAKEETAKRAHRSMAETFTKNRRFFNMSTLTSSTLPKVGE
jgi:hypothetical protein